MSYKSDVRLAGWPSHWFHPSQLVFYGQQLKGQQRTPHPHTQCKLMRFLTEFDDYGDTHPGYRHDQALFFALNADKNGRTIAQQQ